MSERPVIVIGAPGSEDADAVAAQVGARAVSALYLAGIDSLVIDLSTGARLSVPAGVLEGFAAVAPHALHAVSIDEEGGALGLPVPGPRISVADLLAGRYGSPDWMAGHAARTRRLRADQLRRLTRVAMAQRDPPAS